MFDIAVSSFGVLLGYVVGGVYVGRLGTGLVIGWEGGCGYGGS